MKNNKKGFISITVIYSFFILFITIMLLIMYSYINDRKMSNRVKSELINNLRNKAPDVALSMNGSVNPHPLYEVEVNVLDGGNGIASAKYVWSTSPLETPTIDLPSYHTTLTSPTDNEYYYLIVKACDINSNCKTFVSNYYRIGSPFFCVKANTLHTETCKNTDPDNYCLGSGLEENSISIYGLAGGTSSFKLGDAFDCDINNDGTYDIETERFYYLSDYFDTATRKYDVNTASLVYFANVHNGVATNTFTTAYSNGSTNIPDKASDELPTTSQWTNTTLKSTQRNIDSDTGLFLPTTFKYSGTYESYIVPVTGTYKIELWGGQGGGPDNAPGGGGAYTSGEIALTKDEILYVYVGGGGVTTSPSSQVETLGGWNGGGTTGGQNCCSRSYGSGGGATDIRLVAGEWNDFDSLKSRIMVAAGGGGGYSGDNGGWKYLNGGAGGTFTGSDGSQGSDNWCYGTGATQIAGGIVSPDCGRDYTSVAPGGFGYGAGENTNATGGGGGYYGGGRSGHIASAGGGSSYVSGLFGCNSIDEDSTADNIQHTGLQTHYSGKYFDPDTIVMKSGNETVPSKDGGLSTLGNLGNGYARITLVSSPNVSYTTTQYTYTDKAARLLSIREISDCVKTMDVITDNNTTEVEISLLDKCNFLFEATNFNTANKSDGFYLETPYADTDKIWVVDAKKAKIYGGTDRSTSNKYGVRPVIDVPKTNMGN